MTTTMTTTNRQPPPQRDQFSSKIEYFLTALSYAVGLGNVWRFPYLCYRNGGGSFFIPYLLSLVFLGLPFFLFESSLGQFTSLGPIKVWRLTPIFKGIGYAMFFMGSFVGIYYNMLIAWSLYFVYASFTSLPEVPWAHCNNTWNTEHCHEKKGNISNSSTIKHSSPSQEYFYRNVLEMADTIEDIDSLKWHLVCCLAVAWILIYLGLCLGAKSLGKISYFTAIFPYIMITALLVKGVQLKGSWEGIKHYLYPDFSKLSNISVWTDASTQIFYSLSICMGGVITLASYNPFYNNFVKDASLVVICNSLTSIYAGFAIFSIIGFMADQLGVQVEDAADQGAGLAFVAYPAALARLPAPYVWSVIFFFMLITLGFGSQMTIVETLVSTLVDFWPKKLQKRKSLVLLVVCLVMFLCGLPMCTGAGIYILQLMDTFSVPYSAFFIAIFELLAIAWVYGIDDYFVNVKKMIGYNPFPYNLWKFWYKYGCPLIILVLLYLLVGQHVPMKYNDYVYPLYAEYCGWAMTLVSVLIIPFFILYQTIGVLRHDKKTFKDIIKPNVSFGNDDSNDGPPVSFDSVLSTKDSRKAILSSQKPDGYQEKQGITNPIFIDDERKVSSFLGNLQNISLTKQLFNENFSRCENVKIVSFERQNPQ